MEIIIALFTTALLIGIPTYFIMHTFNKADTDETIYTPEEIAHRLKKGYALAIWGTEMAFGSVVLFILMFTNIHIVLKFALPIGYCVIGLILLFIGVVHIETCLRFFKRKRRELTPLEEWTYLAMSNIQKKAQLQHAANCITKATPGVSDDMLAAIGSAGVVHGLFSVGSIYVGKNHWPIFSILLIIGISFFYEMLH